MAAVVFAEKRRRWAFDLNDAKCAARLGDVRGSNFKVLGVRESCVMRTDKADKVNAFKLDVAVTLNEAPPRLRTATGTAELAHVIFTVHRSHIPMNISKFITTSFAMTNPSLVGLAFSRVTKLQIIIPLPMVTLTVQSSRIKNVPTIASPSSGLDRPHLTSLPLSMQ